MPSDPHQRIVARAIIALSGAACDTLPGPRNRNVEMSSADIQVLAAHVIPSIKKALGIP